MRRSRTRTLALLGVASLAASAAQAAGLERLVMPGPLAAAHAKAEEDCANCHRAFDAGAEDGRCLACHEPIALDRESGTGLHGRRTTGGAEQTCRSCHPDHRGRDADITGLDPETFSHRGTDFALEGAHGTLACTACHASDEPYRDAPVACGECHRDDDVHRGRLGSACGDCHRPLGWKEGRFDHASTAFPLEGAHRATDCAACHPGEAYERTPVACSACHAADDIHRGRFGRDCASCHDSAEWRAAGFDHDTRTKFPLRGAHRTVRCDACHAKTPGRAAASLDTRCVSCHAADDTHDGQHGNDCGRCHGEQIWRKARFDHGRDARWPLRGAHAEIGCERCHRAAPEEVTLERACSACHAADDPHRGELGTRCDACHGTGSWSGDVEFDHDMTAFPLLGLHAAASCSECHDGTRFHAAQRACATCHADRDVHERRLGSDCGRCHNPNGWELWRFDHDRSTSFALHGAHRGIDCRACHTAPARGEIDLSSACGDCHALDDAHRGSFGRRCGDCHGTASWQGARISR